jgi:DNA-binding NtrC family response regulator
MRPRGPNVTVALSCRAHVPSRSGRCAVETKNVLLVEDDAALRSLVSEILADAGYRPIPISDHSQIQSALDRWQPCCVILDGEVDRWTGESSTWVDAASIRRTHPQVRVVIFTADRASLAEARAVRSPRSIAASVAGAVSKPFAVDEFLAIVERAVDIRLVSS